MDPRMHQPQGPQHPTEEQRQRLGNWFKRRREESGLSMRDVAQKLEVDHKAISRVEGGQGGPEELLKAIRGFFGDKVDYADAPIDPVKRREYFDRRNEMIRTHYKPRVKVIGAGIPPG